MQKLSRQTKRDLVAYSFIAPNFIGFCVFTLIPIIFAFALAFMKWDGSNPIQWAGLSNFTRLWKDTFFIAAFGTGYRIKSESNRKRRFQNPFLFPICSISGSNHSSMENAVSPLQGTSEQHPVKCI